ncbi:MAG: hypothetical protein LIO54_02440 [Oscillospiraceae bacterium]|nr:hypothetical protein [Oscillospiraceae bacterium]
MCILSARIAKRRCGAIISIFAIIAGSVWIGGNPEKHNQFMWADKNYFEFGGNKSDEVPFAKSFIAVSGCFHGYRHGRMRQPKRDGS